MATIKSYTSLEQSKKLVEILPLESADMYWMHGKLDNVKQNPTPNIIGNDHDEPLWDDYDIPCWSLAALISILPQFIEFKGDKYYLRFMKDYVEYSNDEVSITGRCLHTTGNNNLVDASYEMILKLHEHKMLNKC